jgi:general secretion pathway protein M
VSGFSDLREALTPVRSWWRGLSPRDRGMAALGATVLSLFIVWLVAVQPAWRTVASAPAELDALDVQLQSMQRLAVEANELRATPAVNAEQAAAALKAATDRLGEKGRLKLQGDRAVLTINGAGTAQLRDWLAEARSGARARPVEAKLARGTEGYSGTLVLAIGGGA